VRKLIFFVIAITALSALAFAGVTLFNNIKKPTPPIQSLENLKDLRIGSVRIKVEIAKTPEERVMGLSDRESLAKDNGMLFTFSEKNIKPLFWMKDMRFGLDFIWINDRKVIQIDKGINPPAQGTPDNALQIFSPNDPANYVLEVNSGFSDSMGVKVGDYVDITQL